MTLPPCPPNSQLHVSGECLKMPKNFPENLLKYRTTFRQISQDTKQPPGESEYIEEFSNKCLKIQNKFLEKLSLKEVFNFYPRNRLQGPRRNTKYL
jgi:hypothetical protein